MSEAPERIWLNHTPDGVDPFWFGEPDSRPKDKQPPWPEVQYIRADKHRADLEALREELWQTVAKTANPIKGTPYIAGPSPFCEAIRAFDLDAFQKQREGK